MVAVNRLGDFFKDPEKPKSADNGFDEWKFFTDGSELVLLHFLTLQDKLESGEVTEEQYVTCALKLMPITMFYAMMESLEGYGMDESMTSREFVGMSLLWFKEKFKDLIAIMMDVRGQTFENSLLFVDKLLEELRNNLHKSHPEVFNNPKPQE